MADTGTTTGFDGGAYCPDTGSVAAVSGIDVLTCIFDSTGANLLAVDGEQEAKISLEADTSSVSSKDKKGGWQINTPSTKSWSVDLTTLFVKDAASNLAIRKAFEDGTSLCMKQVYDDGSYTPRCGGRCYVTKYEDDAPSDDNVSISVTLTGTGKLTWFDIDSDAKAKATAKPTNRTA